MLPCHVFQESPSLSTHDSTCAVGRFPRPSRPSLALSVPLLPVVHGPPTSWTRLVRHQECSSAPGSFGMPPPGN